MLEIEVRNFQSIACVKVLVQGFTAILGRSNIGKSAFIRAVQCALTGAVGTDFVRHSASCERHVRGTKKCNCASKVTFKSSKVTFTWEKGDNVNRYTVERPDNPIPEVFEGLDRGTPPFLLPDFRMVQVGSKKELIQIPAQFEPIFLLDQSGPVVADVLSDVARLDCINKAMGLVNKDRKDALAKRKVREEDIRTLTLKLSVFDGLDTVPISAMEAVGVRVHKLQQDLALVDGYIAKAQELRNALQVVQRALAPEMPDIATTASTYSSLLQVDIFQSRAVSGKMTLLGLVEVLKPTLPENPSVQNQLTRLDQVQGLLSKHQDRKQALDDLSGVDVISLPDTSCLNQAPILQRASSLLQRFQALEDAVSRSSVLVNLEKTFPEGTVFKMWPQVSQVEDYLQRYTQLQQVVSRNSELQSIPVVTPGDLPHKVRTLDSVCAWVGRLVAIREGYTTASKEHALAEAETVSVRSALEELGTCPTCNQAFAQGQHLHLGDL